MPKKLYPKALRKKIPMPAEVAAISRQPIVFVLDNIQDTFNVGALFRVADGVAAEKIYLCGWTPTPPNPRIHKAAVGTEHWVPWEYREDTAVVLAELKARSYKAIAIEQHSQSISYVALRESPPVALIVGHETHGISAGVLECADLIVELPMLGVTRSLTVAAAAAVIAYKLLERS
ncbi:TrmH family RNA methyltransferase [Candidatus Acetothermia bacterium]|jgi:tRNA G18 (ribose-2'-O)-methylase SpoU|nr:TrmH family RNA methyltransferase [Candidatus Acetothermia bacterium]MCI2432127.1 TrmH family RNA methyltransferase [Candidatus Acetothermia bacterium]MCI2436747.1 TrmH family RNA methyltransferase [Candidatus Acetothermia bacterium]